MNTLRLFNCIAAPFVIVWAIYVPSDNITKIGATIATIGLAGMASTTDNQ